MDSLVSCAETLVGDSDPNLETCAETLRDEDQTEYFSDDDLDNPYPAVDFDQMMAQGPGAGAQILDRPGRSALKKSESRFRSLVCLFDLLCRRAAAGGGHPAALPGADGARGVPEDHPGQHVLQARHQIPLPLPQQDQGLQPVPALGPAVAGPTQHTGGKRGTLTPSKKSAKKIQKY